MEYEALWEGVAASVMSSKALRVGRDKNIAYQERPSDSPFVEHVWHTQSELDDEFLGAADSRWDMMILQTDGETRFMVTGPMTRPQTLPHIAGSEWLGIRFKLGVMMPHLLASKLVDDGVELVQASGNAFWLKSAAWETPNFDNADTFVDRLMRQDLLISDQMVENVLQGYTHDWSPRSIQYHFTQSTGLTQKTIQQIERAKQAAALLECGVPILDTAFQLGYFDQAHLTNSLKRFRGQTPAQIIKDAQAK
jgi:hypothetical protein